MIKTMYSNMNGSAANIIFSLKAYLKLKPYFILALALLIVTLMLGCIIRIFEIGINGPDLFENLFNSFWVILITMTTSKTVILNIC